MAEVIKLLDGGNSDPERFGKSRDRDLHAERSFDHGKRDGTQVTCDQCGRGFCDSEAGGDSRVVQL